MATKGDNQDRPTHRAPRVAHAVVRAGALAVLERRWDHRVTTVVADAGFGKSVLIGQAVRANEARPRGIEGWVSCRSGVETPDRLVAAVEEAFALAAGDEASTPLGRLQGVFAEVAPFEVSLVLDDVELLSPGCAELLDDLLRLPPANLHLVLVGRPPLPKIPLARFRAADDLLEVTAEHLRFDDREVAALAANLGVTPPRADLGGWPALVRLALSSPEGSVGDYLWEEVISALDADDRRALLALCLLGTSTADEVADVSGRSVDPDGFCARVPLVHQAGGRLVAHELWLPFRAWLGSRAELAAMATMAGAVVAARGDPLAWGEVALRSRDAYGLRRASVALVRGTLGSLPVEVAERWLAGLGADPVGSDSPEAALLDAALTHARVAVEPPSEVFDLLVDRFIAEDDPPGAAVTVALAALAAEARGDLGHLVVLAVRARLLAEQHTDPALDLLVAAVDATAAAIGGDLAAGIARLEEATAAAPPEEHFEALVRLHWHLLLLAGRAAEAAELVADLHSQPGAAVQRELEAVARWLDGDPGALLSGPAVTGPERYQALSDRDRFDQASFVAVIAASAGDVEAVDRALDVLESSPFSAVTSGPDAAMVAQARACRAILAHDDAGATAMVGGLLAAAPLDPFTDAYLRRSLAVPYVCSAELRERWDAADLGPAQQRARDVARALLDARAGHLRSTAPAAHDTVATVLPLPWSVELAARVAGANTAWGAALAVRLVDLFGDAATAALASAADEHQEDPRLRRGAQRVRRAVPLRPSEPVEVRVLGPLEVRRDGRPVDAPELRRSRVRQLLSLLVVERAVTRERAIDALWPDVDLTSGRANLRVTLGHLQRVLEPGRATRSAPYFLRVDTTQLRLAEVAGLDVDLWEVDQLLAAANEAARHGDQAERVTILREVVRRWRGRPLPDLDHLAEPSHVGPRVGARLVDATLALGELELVAGAPDAATQLAERALDDDPYDERAHRLAIAAALQSRDRSRATAAVEHLHEAVEELGLEPDPTSQMLLHNTARWLGRRGRR